MTPGGNGQPTRRLVGHGRQPQAQPRPSALDYALPLGAGRDASQALKCEAFKFAARAAPYNEIANSVQRLNEERERIERDVDDILDRLHGATPIACGWRRSSSVSIVNRRSGA